MSDATPCATYVARVARGVTTTILCRNRRLGEFLVHVGFAVIWPRASGDRDAAAMLRDAVPLRHATGADALFVA